MMRYDYPRLMIIVALVWVETSNAIFTSRC